MLQELNSRLLKQLEQDLEQASIQTNEPLEKLTNALKLVRQALTKLKDFIKEHPFKSQPEQISFFKYTKPSVYQWQIYYMELYTIENGFPFGDVEKQVDYLTQELHYIERLFQQYAFLYQYYKLDANELDSLYFIRGAELQSLLLPAVPDADPGFSTSCDYLFSKFKAFERLKEWVISKLVFLKRIPAIPYQLTNENSEMNWTGDTINLAEIGIGIYHTKQINNGTASLSDIFRWLEEKFQVNIGVPSKRLAELRRRKRLSRTKYLDEMKDSVVQKLDKEDEYEPKR
ncbi:RteC domain-containing protein [Mucilaginibacter sp.]|jgi:hypothetical protein|uniref:RteC domain-containing protein n=1 Tax=Mucilaginibacter sp. TaxID=1882438 RepID=UPI00260995D7|nr:RteC domain-containing protein [Mucilaginibacter sp.]MDB4926581.1 Tetracycline regulation of excision, RteC [Mucilaginibacter sp.]